MKLLFLLLLLCSIEKPLSNDLPELHLHKKNPASEITKGEFARFFNKADTPDIGRTILNLVYEFDCSVPRWRKKEPITSCEVSKNIELVLYEFAKYKGESIVLRYSDEGGFFKIPEKFRTPGSVKVFYKGNKECISSVNLDIEEGKAIDYVTIEEKFKEVVNVERPNTMWDAAIYISNSHPSKTISVRYNLLGRNQNLNTVEVKPNEEKYIIGYNQKILRTATILDAKFID